jgi:hypothetical protein
VAATSSIDRLFASGLLFFARQFPLEFFVVAAFFLLYYMTYILKYDFAVLPFSSKSQEQSRVRRHLHHHPSFAPGLYPMGDLWRNVYA